MRGFVKKRSKSIILNRIILITCALSVVLVWAGCHRKIGIKPGEQLKKDKTQCKCKKRKSAIYSENTIQKSTFYYFKENT